VVGEALIDMNFQRQDAENAKAAMKRAVAFKQKIPGVPGALAVQAN
jgi:hypothetical protein